MSKDIFLDNHSTTPLDPRVLAEMLPIFTEDFGNPSSRFHRFGWRAEAHVEKARTSVTDLIGALHEREIVFTSGATESNNLAIKGVLERTDFPGRLRIITSAIEHPSVLETCAALEESLGCEVIRVGVDADGRVNPDEIARAIDVQPDRTALVSIMLANNEIGTLQPVSEIGAICRARKVLFHVDAAQAAGKIRIDVQEMKIDLLTLTAHKFNGPKGVGALYVRRRDPRVELVPQIHGGGHERGLRSGTLNVPGIVGLGAAARIASENMVEEQTRVAGLRDRLWAGIRHYVPEARVHGHFTRRLAGNLNVYLPAIPGDPLMLAMRGVAISAASACGSQANEPSHVLQALGLSEEEIHCSVRFGVGRFTTDAEIEQALCEFGTAVETIRKNKLEELST